MNLPAPFILAARTLLGEDGCRDLATALDTAPPVSIRLNPAKQPDGLCLADDPVPWCESGCYLPQRPAFTFDPLFHAGCYYVQEASSMFLEQALKQCVPARPLTVLDLCAAPGGKSTHALGLLPPGSLLVANEVIRSRTQVLAENLTKWGSPSTVVTRNDPAGFAALPETFDILLADVPCSGEGMFRKDPAAIGEWSAENVALCSQRQRRILSDAWPCLKPGGLLVYSTCTYNTQENEDNVAWICRELGAEPVPLSVPDAWNITGSLAAGPLPVYRFLPHRTRGEGFFLAVLRKAGDEAAASSLSPFPTGAPRKAAARQRTPTLPPQAMRTVRGWVEDPDEYAWNVTDRTVSAFPARHRALLDRLRQSLHIVQAGTDVAEAKGKDLLPLHGLAMSTALRRDAFPTVALDRNQAIAYLRKESVALPADTPHGFLLLTYRHVPLGFAKNIGSRANNLYPAAWRIRSGYAPEDGNIPFI